METASSKSTVRPLTRLASFADPYKRFYIESIAFAVIGVACGFLSFVTVAAIAAAIIAGDTNPLSYFGWCALAAAGQVAKAFLSGASTLISHKATFSVLSEVRRALAAKLERMPLGYVLETPSGTLKTPFVERSEQLEVPLSHVVPEMTANLLVPTGIIAFIFTLDWRMGLASLVIIPIGMNRYVVGMRDYAEKHGRVVAAKNHMGATIVEYIGGIEVIKAFGRSALSYSKFTDAVKANSGLMLDWMRATLPWTAVMLNVWPSVFLGVLSIGCRLIMNGSLAPATFITVIVLSLGISGPLFAAIMFINDIAKISTIMDEIGVVLDQPEMNRPKKPCQIQDLAVELDNVTFFYGDKAVLKGVNLSIASNTTVAFVGPSGSGKSTIAKLIASQWEADSGTVRIGGTDMRNMPLSQVADGIAYVAQDNYLFNDTIMNNIRMGCAGATDTGVVTCAKASGCHEFIEALPEVYDTMLGEGGATVSGGEKQRISIARAFLKDAPYGAFG